MFLQILFLARAKIESEEVSDDEKTDISAAVGGHAGQPAGLRGSAKTLSAKTLRIAGLKGPTTMGLVNLLSMEKNGTAAMDYDLQLYGAADEIVPKLIKGNLDMAAIPANLAATLYQKTNGGIQVLAVNTLGVLYVVEKGDTVHSFADLKAAPSLHGQGHHAGVRPALPAHQERPGPR